MFNAAFTEILLALLAITLMVAAVVDIRFLREVFAEYGIPVDVEIVVTDNFFVYAEESFKDMASVRATFTNPANGNSVIVSNAGQVSGPPPIIDEDAGTITFLTNFKGLPEKIQTANGPVLLRDAGFVQFADTFDLETGDFISSEVVFVKGPHPELDSDFALFCDVISDALE